MVLFPKNVFTTVIARFFGFKKSENFQNWKIRKYDEETLFWKKNAFIF